MLLRASMQTEQRQCEIEILQIAKQSSSVTVMVYVNTVLCEEVSCIFTEQTAPNNGTYAPKTYILTFWRRSFFFLNFSTPCI
jgi:hypothetical protein